MKEKILRAVNHRNCQLVNSKKNGLSSKIEMKLAKLSMNVIWTANLLETSLTVTRTPKTTLKSIIRANLNLKNGEKGKMKDLNAVNNKSVSSISPQELFGIKLI